MHISSVNPTSLSNVFGNSYSDGYCVPQTFVIDLNQLLEQKFSNLKSITEHFRAAVVFKQAIKCDVVLDYVNMTVR